MRGLFLLSVEYLYQTLAKAAAQLIWDHTPDVRMSHFNEN